MLILGMTCFMAALEKIFFSVEIFAVTINMMGKLISSSCCLVNASETNPPDGSTIVLISTRFLSLEKNAESPSLIIKMMDPSCVSSKMESEPWSLVL